MLPNLGSPNLFNLFMFVTRSEAIQTRNNSSYRGMGAEFLPKPRNQMVPVTTGNLQRVTEPVNPCVDSLFGSCLIPLAAQGRRARKDLG